MTSIGTAPTPAIYQDRAAYAQRVADMSGGKQTVEDVTAQLEASDRMKLKQAQNDELFLSGKGVNVNGTTPEMVTKALAQAREARSQHFSLAAGPVLIEAMNVDSAVKAQSTMTGGDLKSLSQYGEYLRNEVAAASKVRSDVTFHGTWGKDRVTNDVNEYVSWLYKAAQNNSSASQQVG